MQSIIARNLSLAAILGCLATSVLPSTAQTGAEGIRIVKLAGTVEELAAGVAAWTPARTNDLLHPGDQLRTGPNSLVSVVWPHSSVVSFDALTELEVLAADSPDGEPGLQLTRGILSFFHRDRPGRIRVQTRAATAGVEGTEFVIQVDDAGQSTLSVIDGRVVFTNAQSGLVLTNGQRASAVAGAAPVPSPGFIVNDLLQWSFYYPAVLDVADLSLSAAEQQALNDSLSAYRSGDLLAALARYPAGRQPGSDAERVYHAALLLSVGQVAAAETELNALTGADPSGRPQRAAAALRLQIATVKRQPAPALPNPQTATEYLAASYHEQSLATGDASLGRALDYAREAARLSPDSGFAWERVAELEFSFGRTQASENALDTSLARAPRNAEALALRGFVQAAQGQVREGIRWFDQALSVDSALGNAWVGRGLSRIHLGDTAGGREDLLIAAALEPQRAILRSYLGKAYGDAGNFTRATNEFRLAEDLDPKDPTAWLYSALVKQEHGRINEAIRDLETSEDLNSNRSVYRSKLLLEQDQAVRSANLASMYRDAGMFDVGVREAGRAVNEDYANYSGHLFLAESYDQLQDPNGINLRYETPSSAEFLVANLLAPVNAGPFSSTISQQEYSPLFERSKLGIASSTEYLSRGAWTESGAAYGNTDKSSFDFESFYHWDPGQRMNNDIYQRQFSLALKQQLTSQDTIYVRASQFEGEAGDLFEYYNNNLTNSTLRDNEQQQPIIGLGYHHEWSPGVHTLVYATRLDDTFEFTNQSQPIILAVRPDDTNVPGGLGWITAQYLGAHAYYRDKLNIYSAEIQQIWELAEHTTIVGGRFQYGRFHTDDLEDNTTAVFFFSDPAAQLDTDTLFRRFTFYGYHQWQIVDSLQLIGGLTYDQITYPENIQTMPISTGDRTSDQLSPKAGFIWRPADRTTVRFAYTTSLGGASFDQSIQLEPAQVAGFTQSFRSIIPESVAGEIPGARFETFDLSVEQNFPSGTYLGLSGEILNSQSQSTVGAYALLDAFPNAVPSGFRERLDYQEQTVQLTLNQLLGNRWSLGAKYRLSEAILHENFVDMPDGLLTNGIASPVQPRQRLQGTLNSLDLTAFYNDPRGLFAEGEALWYAQNNRGELTPEPGDSFWQFNVFAGYRSPRRRMEATVGLLNLNNRDYNLDPLNLYNELPRKRTILARLRLSF